MADFGSRQGLRDELILYGGPFAVGPWHQRVDVLVEMTVGQLREQVLQIGVWLDAIQPELLDCFPSLNKKGSIRISYAHGLTGRIPTAAARTARGVGCLGSTAR